jgi:hypothetical protein
MGLVIGLFALVGDATPIWMIVLQAVAFGYVSSLQYTSMNTLVTPTSTSATRVWVAASPAPSSKCR